MAGPIFTGAGSHGPHLDHKCRAVLAWDKRRWPMRTLLKRGLQILLVLLVLAVGVAVWKRDLVLRLMAVNALFDESRIVQNFSHMDTMFLTRPLSRGDGPVAPLPPSPPARDPVARSGGLGQGSFGDGSGDAQGRQAGP